MERMKYEIEREKESETIFRKHPKIANETNFHRPIEYLFIVFS